MNKLVTQSGETAQFYELVNEAEAAARCDLNENTESYLVFLLMNYLKRPDWISRILSIEYLKAVTEDGQTRKVRLKEVGDQCLLYSGLFPKRAERMRLRIGYFVDLGRGAYNELSRTVKYGLAEIYADVCQDFVTLMEVMQAMRHLDPDRQGLSPLAALELWQDTGSRYSLSQHIDPAGAVPVKADYRSLH
jgi:hypothetical protein